MGTWLRSHGPKKSLDSMHWIQNDGLFKEQLEIGVKWQAIPRIFFELQGFDVQEAELVFRDSVRDIPLWQNEMDLVVDGWGIQVKSRTEKFTNRRDWPDDRTPAFVDTVDGWSKMVDKPLAYVFVSQLTGGMVWTPGDRPMDWRVVVKPDRVRGIRSERFYATPKHKLHSMDKLVNLIRPFR